MPKPKPFNGDAGYKASLRAAFGHLVIYDRASGGDWIDAKPVGLSSPMTMTAPTLH